MVILILIIAIISQMNHIFRLGFLFIFSLIFSYCGSLKSKKKSLEDLRLAYTNKSIAAEKYEKFSQAALNEGYDTLAQLFIAASKSERIHSTNFGKIIELYGQDSATPETGNFEVKSTKENLKSAIKTEMFDMLSVYPGFIRTAEREKSSEIARSFSWVNNCEKRYLLNLRTAASILVKGNETGIPFIWYVCSGCGNIYNKSDVPLKCEFCLTKQDNFIGFSKKTD